MLHILLSTTLCLLAAEAGQLAPPAKVPAAQQPAADPLEAELFALARDFGVARSVYEKRLDELRKQGDPKPESKLAHPAVEYWPRIADVSRRGSVPARLWLALQFPNAHPELNGEARDKLWREFLLAAVDSGVNTPVARDLSRSLTVLYLDAPGALVDEAVELFVQKSTTRELAADALYRASVARRRGSQELASPKAKEFGKRLAADYSDSTAARSSRGEGEVGLVVGKFAPEFTAQDADGVAFKLSDYRGKVVVLDFWGFW